MHDILEAVDTERDEATKQSQANEYETHATHVCAGTYFVILVKGVGVEGGTGTSIFIAFQPLERNQTIKAWLCL